MSNFTDSWVEIDACDVLEAIRTILPDATLEADPYDEQAVLLLTGMDSIDLTEVPEAIQVMLPYSKMLDYGHPLDEAAIDPGLVWTGWSGENVMGYINLPVDSYEPVR